MRHSFHVRRKDLFTLNRIHQFFTSSFQALSACSRPGSGSDRCRHPAPPPSPLSPLRILIHIDRCACHCLRRVDQSLVCQSALALGNNLPGVARCSSRPCSNVGLGSRAVPAHITDVRGTEGHDSVRVERSDKAVHALALMGKDFRLSCFVLAALRDLL
jgi:hypothetical protein